MKVLKFRINEDYYKAFQDHCKKEDITIKRKLNVLLAQDRRPENIDSYFPEEHTHNLKRLTLKVNEELYKGVMKQCGRNDFRVSTYLAYLIYKFLSDKNS